MATKKTTVNKNTVNNKKSAAKSAQVTNQGTRVVCPECGAEFDILAEHEHTVKNATVIGADSGLGTIYLPVSKRGEALKSAGIDTSKYFSLRLPTGGEQLMTYDENGTPVAVKADDPIMQQIINGGTVPNRNLFRRWVMSQVFHWLNSRDQAAWLRQHGYKYQWEMLVEELRVQTRLYKNGDMENFKARNRWFDKALAIEMAYDHIEQMRKDANDRPQHKCKGVPYVKYDCVNYFVSDIEKKLIEPMRGYAMKIQTAKNPQQLHEAVKQFCGHAHLNVAGDCKQHVDWKDSYKGMGAYATMQNLLRFHGCTFPKDNDFYKRNRSGLDCLEAAAGCYQDGEGWRLFGLMKQMIDENGIDINAKMRQWAAAKDAKNLRR